MPLRRTAVRLAAIALLTAVASAQEANPGASRPLPPGLSDVIRDFDQTAAQAIKNPADTGYTLGVVTVDGLAWTRSVGYADGARQTPASAETVYRIGSGAFSSVMLLQLVRDGTVHLSDPVAKYVTEIGSIPSAYPGSAPITLLQLAVHTSGLTPRSGEVSRSSAGGPDAWERTLVAALPHAGYAFEPGTHAALSALDNAVLALALGRAAGQPYAEFVRRRILEPLGMTHSNVLPAAADSLSSQPEVATTVGDLARFAQFMMLAGPDTVLPRRDLETNYRRTWVVNSVAVPNPSEGFGIGFDGETWTSNRLAHYYFIVPIGFDGPGYDAALWFEPRRHAGVILLHQGGASALGQMIHTYVYTLNAQPIDAGRQDPIRPLPYAEEAVTFENKAAAISLAGTLTMPHCVGPCPAVVLVPRSGPFDRDEKILNHSSFLILADGLTRRGIAVLRTDVRGVGKSSGRFTGDRDDSASDLEAAVSYLRTRVDVDPKRIGLLGHGEGGLVASDVAGRDPGVAFTVLMGTPAVPMADNAVESARLTAEGNGEISERADAQAADLRRMFSVLQQEKDPDTRDAKLRALLAGKLPDAQIAAQIRQWTSPAFQRQLSNEPAAALSKITCPVLALYGDKDLQVPLSLNLPAMRTALAKSHGASAVVDEVPDVNFLFQTADVGIGREANWTQETMAPSVLQTIGDWIARRVGA